MTTQTLVNKARALFQNALATIDREIQLMETKLSELRAAREMLFEDVGEDSNSPAAARTSGRSTSRAMRAMTPASRRTPKLDPKKKEQAFNRLPERFTKEDTDRRNIAPISLAHWTRAGKITKMADGSYKKIGIKRQTPAERTIASRKSSRTPVTKKIAPASKSGTKTGSAPAEAQAASNSTAA